MNVISVFSSYICRTVRMRNLFRNKHLCCNTVTNSCIHTHRLFLHYLCVFLAVYVYNNLCGFPHPTQPLIFHAPCAFYSFLSFHQLLNFIMVLAFFFCLKINVWYYFARGVQQIPKKEEKNMKVCIGIIDAECENHIRFVSYRYFFLAMVFISSHAILKLFNITYTYLFNSIT